MKNLSLIISELPAAITSMQISCAVIILETPFGPKILRYNIEKSQSDLLMKHILDTEIVKTQGLNG